MSPRVQKKKRIEKGSPPRVLDLFSGCGGFSLGFHSAGFKISSGVELDEDAARTHAQNFLKDGQDKICHDIRETDPADLFEDVETKEQLKKRIDVVVGGPPCQAFSRVGRAKLREVEGNPGAFLEDSRSNLYLRYLHYVRSLDPLAVVVENVPDVLNYGDLNIAEEICEVLEKLGYTCRYTLLNSAHYGVPQMRDRMILVGYATELEYSVEFPALTHWIDLPIGYQKSRRAVINRAKQEDLFDNYFVRPPKPSGKEKEAVTARDALKDLPVITRHLSGNLPKGRRSFDTLQEYPDGVSLSAYGKLMREWPGFENSDGVHDHSNAIRNVPRDFDIFRLMEPGDQYPEAHDKAVQIFLDCFLESHKKNDGILIGGEKYKHIRDECVPPYDPDKFPNKWRKIEPDEPARTLTAHIGKDTYSHIHYDSNQARTISVREAARLQSFPDGFDFAGSMSSRFRQIGNAVPPLLCYRIAQDVADALGLSPSGSLPSFDQSE